MTQYVIQIETASGWLAKSFQVTEENPIPSYVPPEREQIIMTNTTNFNAIVTVYAEHATSAIFSYDEPGGKIDCAGAVTDSWSIN